MGDTWVTDMRQFEKMVDAEHQVPLASIRLGEHFGRIVRAATCWVPGITMDSAVRCRRRPGRRPCPGHIRLYRAEVPPQINWQCSACDDKGIIRGWRETMWDLSGQARATHPEVKVTLSRREFMVLDRILGLDRQAERVVCAAITTDSGILLTGGVWEINHLAGFVVHESANTSTLSRRKVLGRIADKLEAALQARRMGGARVSTRRSASDSLPKISQTLLEFSRPALELVGDDAPEPLIREVLWVTVDIWNAVVLEQRGIEGDFVERMRAVLEQGVPSMVPVMDLLVERKRKLFSADLRAIRDVEVFRDSGRRLGVRAVASMPEGPRV
jgi:hypothetical protein